MAVSARSIGLALAIATSPAVGLVHTRPGVVSARPMASSRRAPAAPRPPVVPAPPPAPGLTHEGPAWVETVNGVETIPAGNTLRLWSLGPVSLAGDQGKDVRYTLVKRVSAPNEAEARRLFGQFVVRSSYKGDTTSLEIRHGGADRQSAELRVLVPRSLRSVSIETHGGDIDASDLQGALLAVTGGGRMKVARIGGAVESRTAGGQIDLDAIGGSVKCMSAGGRIRAGSIRGGASFQTGGGEIQVDEVGGTARAVTAGGDIVIRRAGAGVVANTAGGAIQVDEAREEVRAETLGGSIQVGSAAGVRCETGGGGIRLNNVSGKLSATTAVGNIFALLASGRALSDSYLATSAGDITVMIPANYAVTIKAENERTGRTRTIVSEFPGIAVRGEGPLAVAEGAINGGGPVLRLSGMGGMIYIKKQQN